MVAGQIALLVHMWCGSGKDVAAQKVCAAKVQACALKQKDRKVVEKCFRAK